MVKVYTDAYGDVTRPQLAAYRKYNISPADHYDLVEAFGNDTDAIIEAVIWFSPRGIFDNYLFVKEHLK